MTLKLKSQTFEVKTRAVTLSFYISTAEEIKTQAIPLLESEMPHAPFRLMGVRLSSFENQNRTRQCMITDFTEPFRDLQISDNAKPSLCHHTSETTPSYANSVLNREILFHREDWKCEECGMHCCSERCLQEHNDFHFAYQIQREENTLPPVFLSKTSVPIKGNRAQKKTSKKRKTLQTMTLDAFVLRHSSRWKGSTSGVLNKIVRVVKTVHF